MRDFVRLARRRLDGSLAERGFEYRDGCYRRIHPSGLEHRVTLDNRGRNPGTFSVMVGLRDPEAFPESDGNHLLRYFTGGSLSTTRKDFGCRDQRELDRRLERLISQFEAVLEPFFASVPDRLVLAEALADQPMADLLRGCLYFRANDKQRARPELVAYLRRIEALSEGLEQVREQRRRVEAMLAEC